MKNRVSSLFREHHRIVGACVALVLVVAAILTIPLLQIQAQNKPSTTSPDEAAAIAASGKPAPAAVAPAVANAQTAVACQMCFTCGGDWPIFAGAVHAVNTGSLTHERGAGCSGALLASNDSNPFLCCR